MGKNVVKEKSFIFSIRIVKLYKYLTNDKKEFVMTKQLLHSGTAIGGTGNLLIAPFDGVMKNLVAEIGINPNGGDTINLGFQLNSSITNLKKTWTGGETGRKENLQNEIDVKRGDIISIEVNGATNPGARNIKVNMELEPI